MKLRIIHLLTHPDDERERRSIAHVSPLAKMGEYIQIVNPVYEGELPPARETNDRPFTLGPGHYGCWKAHKDAITEYLTDDIDALLICECDCVFAVPPDEVEGRIKRAYDACLKHDLLAFNFGYKHDSVTLQWLGDVLLVSQWVESHCYMLTPKSRPVFMEMFERAFDTYDYCLTIYLLDQQHERVGVFDDRPVAVQADGPSLVDGKLKLSEQHYRNVRY